MINMDRWLACEWVSDGMDYPRLNCWGLVRLARMELFGKPELPRFDVHAEDKRRLTEECHNVVSDWLVECVPAPGAIAACWRGRLCVHVALLVQYHGRLSVLEIDKGYNARVTRHRDWIRNWIKVTYYDDKPSSLP